MTAKFTAGPWRWELNEKHKQIQLCGGKPTFDKTVMGFARYGMGGAAPLFINPNDEMCILERAEFFGEIFSGREHHADWFKTINTPDANLIAAAPELYEALEAVLECLDMKHGTEPYDGGMAALAKTRGEQP